MADTPAVSWFGSPEGLTELARHRCDPHKGRGGPRIGRDQPVAQVRGVLAERVVVSTALDPFLSLRALAGYSGLSVRTLRNLLKDPVDPLPYYRIGGKLLVRCSEYDLWAARRRETGDVDVNHAVTEVLGALGRN